MCVWASSIPSTRGHQRLARVHLIQCDFISAGLHQQRPDFQIRSRAQGPGSRPSCMRCRPPPSATPSPGPAPLATCPAAPAAQSQALRASLEMKCKCHGVSGSCSIRTCWKGLQELRDVATDLKTRYLSATKVVHRPMGTRKHLVPKDLDIRPVKDSELVYLQSSPDFCMKNEKVGSHGTQDRQCNKTSNGSDSCDLMCCGRGYNPYTDRVVERCHCKYHWCCYVTCRRCERTVERYVCK
ncbi:protein Wnt-11 isoform X2 [Castor canadensis]|uniref:Protein Wnt-11 isoform X2 n=2 Tax=Castor canadensis TaxID=51338 RepID=A0AC58NAN9_CASCN